MARDKAKFWAESNEQIGIVQYLRTALPPFYSVISIPNGRYKLPKATASRLKREGLHAGVFDLMVIRNDGWVVSLEVKAEDGDLSDSQKQWSDWLSQGGACQAVVRNAKEAEDALRSFGVPLRGRVAA